MKKAKFNDAAARAYIQGEEPFDPAERELSHVERLIKTVEEHAPRCADNLIFRSNFRRTVSHWIELHQNAANIQKLIDAYRTI